MSRRRQPEKRVILPDPQFADLVLSKFINNIMIGGKKSIAEGIVYGALEVLDGKKPVEKAEGDADAADVTVAYKSVGLGLFHAALKNVRPRLEVRSRRVGGATYQVPVEVRPDRRQALAIRWLVSASRSRNENTMRERLAGELLDASNNRGTAVKKREDTHRMAEANRAFSHYRW